jgi:hypothetical protein
MSETMLDCSSMEALAAVAVAVHRHICSWRVRSAPNLKTRQSPNAHPWREPTRESEREREEGEDQVWESVRHGRDESQANRRRVPDRRRRCRRGREELVSSDLARDVGGARPWGGRKLAAWRSSAGTHGGRNSGIQRRGAHRRWASLGTGIRYIAEDLVHPCVHWIYMSFPVLHEFGPASSSSLAQSRQWRRRALNHRAERRGDWARERGAEQRIAVSKITNGEHVNGFQFVGALIRMPNSQGSYIGSFFWVDHIGAVWFTNVKV